MTSDPVADLLASNFIVLDFETYYASDFTLSKMTTADYIRDPRFETIGVGVIAPGFKEPRWFEHAEFVDWARSVDWSSAVVLAHHSHFDGLICSHHYHIRPGYWLDTLSMARALHPAAEVGGSLSKLMAYYKVGQKGDEVVKALGKRRRDFTTDEWLRYGEYCKNDCLGTLGIFVKMAAGFPIAELDAIDTTIRMFTEPEFRIDEPMLQKYLLEEQDRKKHLLLKAEADKELLMSNPKFAAALLELGATPPRKVSKRTGEETFAFAKSDPGMQALLEHDDDAVRALAEARIGVKSTINETRTERLLRSGRSGAPVPVYLKYYGAHTGRWSGGDRMNFQNFTRGGTMRKALLAPEGSVIVVADSSQIEARITAWLAGQEHLVEAFRENRDVYSEFASSAYGRTITKKDETERFVGKVSILGLGYGMGWYKLAESLAAGSMGGKKIVFTEQLAQELGVSVGVFAGDPKKMRFVDAMPSLLPLEARTAHCAVAEFFVQRYRRENHRIPALWKQMDFALADMARFSSFEEWRGPVMVGRHALKLPNGLRLRYPGLEEEDGSFSYMGGHGGKERVKIYGGLLTENVVQALARIVVTEQMQALRERFGYKVVLMTHDEIVCSVPEAQGEEALKNMLDVMKTPPTWAPGLPVSAEGGWNKSYGKAKK